MPIYQFGKHPAKYDYRTLFQNYITAGLAALPLSFNVLTNVNQKLKTANPTTLFPIDGNDTLGDCTIAGLAHATTVYNGLLEEEKIMPKASVVAL